MTIRLAVTLGCAIASTLTAAASDQSTTVQVAFDRAIGEADRIVISAMHPYGDIPLLTVTGKEEVQQIARHFQFIAERGETVEPIRMGSFRIAVSDGVRPILSMSLVEGPAIFCPEIDQRNSHAIDKEKVMPLVERLWKAADQIKDAGGRPQPPKKKDM